MEALFQDMRQAVRMLARNRGFAFIAVLAMALVLAAVDIYGVFSYQVAQCTREIGIRMALRAQPSNVLSLVMRQGVLLSISGLVLGLVGAWAGTRYLSSLLFGIEATDPVTYALAALLMALVAGAAGYRNRSGACSPAGMTGLRRHPRLFPQASGESKQLMPNRIHGSRRASRSGIAYNITR